MPVYMPDINQHLQVKTLNIVAHHTGVHRELWSSEQRQVLDT